MGFFIFLGLMGVGKIFLVKVFVKFIFGEEDVFIQIDMLEYMEKYNVLRLVGVFLGYVGFEEGGQLMEKICWCFYFVVFFDEIEKVYYDVFNMFLQIMEEGKLIDSFGCNIDFCNCILIMIFNIGVDIIIYKAGMGFGANDEKCFYENMKKELLIEVEKYF